MAPIAARDAETVGRVETRLRVVVADDERPARAFLISMLRTLPAVTLVGEAESGSEAVRLIERHRPDVALLDVQMPEVDGFGVVRLVRRRFLPLVIFVTAYDDFAVQAFDVNAVDYLTKPVSALRLGEALDRVRGRLERTDLREAAEAGLRNAVEDYEETAPPPQLSRIPVRTKDHIVLVPAAQVASIVADGQLLHLTTVRQERYTFAYRLKALEERLDRTKFVRLGRGALANVDHILRITPVRGGTYIVRLQNGQDLDVSRLQSRVLRDRLLHL